MTWNWDHNSKWNSDQGSIFNVVFWPVIIITSWIVTRGHNSTLNCDLSQDSTLQFDPGSWFYVELWPMSWFQVELWPESRFHVAIRPRVMILRWIVTHVLIPSWIVTLGLDFMLNNDPRSEFHFESWPRSMIHRYIVTWDWDHNLMSNSDPGSYRSEVSLVMPVNGSDFQKEDNSFIKSVSTILNPFAIPVCNFLTIHVLMLWLFSTRS